MDYGLLHASGWIMGSFAEERVTVLSFSDLGLLLGFHQRGEVAVKSL